MPIEAFWLVRDLILKADYLISTSHETESVGDIYKKIYKKMAPYAVNEGDRTWLYTGEEG